MEKLMKTHGALQFDDGVVGVPEYQNGAQGFQKVKSTNRTDRHTDRQSRPNPLPAAFMTGNKIGQL